MVALYRDLGVRQMHFAYNRNNLLADGCHDAERGLTPLGLRMVEAVNATGQLSQALQKVGMSAAEAAGVMGNNMLRVAGQVWQQH